MRLLTCSVYRNMSIFILLVVIHTLRRIVQLTSTHHHSESLVTLSAVSSRWWSSWVLETMNNTRDYSLVLGDCKWQWVGITSIFIILLTVFARHSGKQNTHVLSQEMFFGNVQLLKCLEAHLDKTLHGCNNSVEIRSKYPTIIWCNFEFKIDAEHLYRVRMPSMMPFTIGPLIIE